MYMEMEAANASSYKIALNTYTLYIYWRRKETPYFALCISSDLVPRNIELAIHVTKDDMDDREAWFFTGNNAHKHIYIINFYIYTYSPIKLTEPELDDRTEYSLCPKIIQFPELF